MLELVHWESERLLTRYRLCELQKHLENSESRLEKILDLKYQVQEIMISNNKESEKIDEFTNKLDEKAARFDLVVADVEKAMKHLSEGENVKTRYTLEVEQKKKN